MIRREDIMPISFLKMEKFTGSFRGMRYRMEMTKIPADEEKGIGEQTVLSAVHWPEPFAFDATPQEQKVRAEFDFSEDGIEKAVDWLNREGESAGRPGR